MKTRTETHNLDLFLEVKNDKKGDLLFKAIEDNNKSYLEELIKHNADITLVQNKYNCLQYAALLKHWDCALILIEDSKNYLELAPYLNRIGQVLLLAAKANEHNVLREFFKLIKLTERKVNVRAGGSLIASFKEYNDQVLFSKSDGLGRPSKLWRDEEGYTALHWAVKHDNADACGLFTLFEYGSGTSSLAGGDSTIYRAKDNVGNTPFGLAMGLDHFDCAKAIAKGMTFSYLKKHESNQTLFKTLLNDIPFNHNKYKNYPHNYRIKPYLSDKLFSSLTDQKTKLFYEYFLTLSAKEKEKVGELLFTKDTTLNLFFRNRFAKEYEELIIEELSKIKHEENTDNAMLSI